MPESTPPVSSRCSGWVPSACSVAILLVLVCALHVGPIDDTYIFLRYARNIVEGAGPVFNAGERVEGFSSPLWTGVLALLGLVFDLERASVWAGVVSACACLVMVALGGRRHPDVPERGQGALTLVLACGMACCPVLFFAAGSGMDSALFAALVTASLLSSLADLPRGEVSLRTCLLLIFSAMCRSEGLLLAGLAFAHAFALRMRLRVVWVFGAAVVAAQIGRFAYYGAWVPNTAYAKIAFSLFERLSRGGQYLADAWPVVVPLTVLVSLSLARMWRLEMGAFHRTTLLAGWIGLYLAYVWYVGGDNIPAYRFLLPVIPAACLLALELWRSAPEVRPGTRGLAIGGFAVIVLAANVASYQRVSRGYFINMDLARAWSNVGRWINEQTPAETVIATPVVGAIGYFGRRTTIDMLGLTDRTVAREGRVYTRGAHGHARHHTDYILERAPDLVVYMSSGRFAQPTYTSPERIHKGTGYALYDFAADPRTQASYRFQTARLADGTLVEMLARSGWPGTVTLADGRSRRPD